jgi:hypothetical protein
VQVDDAIDPSLDRRRIRLIDLIGRELASVLSNWFKNFKLSNGNGWVVSNSHSRWIHIGALSSDKIHSQMKYRHSLAVAEQIGDAVPSSCIVLVGDKSKL